MKVGIGLPSGIPGVTRNEVLQWAAAADDGPFSSIAVIDRVAFGSHDPLIALAAIAAVTTRIRLMSTVILGPTHNAGILAKQAATIDVMSEGRLSLGLGVGARREDYELAGADFSDRGRRFDADLAKMKEIWREGRVGPTPIQVGGPEIILGGYSLKAIGRVGAIADGYIQGRFVAMHEVSALYGLARESWSAHGRDGQPRLLSGLFFALGDDVRDRAVRYLLHYYDSSGSSASARVSAIVETFDELPRVLQVLQDVGSDEVVCWPCVPDVDQVERLANLVETMTRTGTLAQL